MIALAMDPVEGGCAELLERAEELGELRRLIARAGRGDGATVLVEGPAGIGKTCLLEACAEAADARAMRVLGGHGDELASESPFAGVRELLWREVLAAGPEAFEGAAGLAAPVFEGDGESGERRDRTTGVLHGLYWLLCDLADRGPLVLLVDDAHWLDPASLRFFVYLARRIGSLPVLLVIALRPGEANAEGGVAAALAELAEVVLRPAPLSERATTLLVRRELGARADEELCRSCHHAARGNPFYVRALAAAIRSEGERPSVGLARRVRALGAGAVARSVLVRLARLGADCERLAQVVAVLAPGSPLRHGAELAGLSREQAESAADRLRAVELLAARRTLSFVHPVVAEAVAAQLAPSRRASLHLRAAELLRGEGASANRVAAHLMGAEPYGEAWVVEVLRAAARGALAQGAPEVAASYLRRAISEPPPPELRLAVLRELGAAETELPHGQDFPALREALALAQDPREHAEIALELGWGLAATGRGADIAALLEPELDRCDRLDCRLVTEIEGLLLGGGGSHLPASRGIWARVRPHLEQARRGEISDPVMLAALAMVGATAGLDAAEAGGFARLAVRDERLLRFLTAYDGAAGALSWTDHLDEAARAADAVIAEAQRRGSSPTFMHGSVFRADSAFRAGELDLAEDHARRAFELGAELAAGDFALMFLIPVLIERDRAAEALALAGSLQTGESQPPCWQAAIVQAQCGRAKVALGHLEPGIADMFAAERQMAAGGCDLSVIVDWVPSAALALMELGREREARQLAERELFAAVAFGARRRHGIALSVCGLLDPGARGLHRIREGVDVLERTPARLEHARALAHLGTGLRARGQHHDAREPLMQALDLAHRCGGMALAERARAELIKAGARPRRPLTSGPESLTPAELRTGRMAADGLTNREIAQALFVSAKTVEAHLSHAYAKLGIASRAELGAALRSTGWNEVAGPPAATSPPIRAATA